MKQVIAQLAACFFVLFSLTAQSSQLSHYNSAKKALADKNHSDYRIHIDAMGDYLLKPIVEYEYLQSQFSTLDNETIESFINENDAVYVSASLKKKWLRRLAKQKDWQRFEKHYDDSVKSIELECYHLYRRIRASGISSAMDERIRELWLTHRSRPSSCTGVFKSWKRAGKMSEELFWERIKLTIEKDKEKRARSLVKAYLPTEEHIWIDHWVAVHKNPVDELSKLKFPVDSENSVRVILYGLEQIARKGPSEAGRIWETLLKKSSYLKKHKPEAYAAIGYRAAINHHPNATQWLRKASLEEEKVRHWAIRTALREGHWKDVLKFYDKLTDEEKSDLDWRYWQARALENLDKKKQAKKIYEDIAKQREYYSFLAADRIGARYQMNDHEIKASTEALSQSRAFKIAKELSKIGEPSLMRLQWQWAVRDLEGDTLLAAAKLAQKWGLHDRAILTAARAKHFDDVELRFPVVYKELISRQAKLNHLPSAYVYSVMRQESAFMENAKSPAGALGLMQIMPGTGRVISKKQKRGKFRSSQLLDADTNIDMGTFYLRYMLDRFGGNYAMATAAYNAGPKRPRQWQGNRDLDADIWIENIPFKETRNYVKKVMFCTAIYQQRLKLKHEPISKILSRVPGKG